MTEKDAYKIGRDYGYSLGSGIIMNGDVRYTDHDSYLSVCFETDDYSRQDADFSFIAYDINNSSDDDWRVDANWDAYDNGLLAGFKIAYRLHEGKR